MITIKNLIRFEQLRKKSFFLIDYTDEEDVTALLYVTSGMSDTYTLKTYEELLKNGTWLKKEQARLEAESALAGQYQQIKDKEDAESKEETQTLESIISDLVAGGIDPDWLYNKMDLCDLPSIIESFTNRERSRLEEKRLFTAITVMPHVKGIKDPKQILTFPWEKVHESKKLTEEERLKAETVFKDFLKNGLKVQ